MKRMLAAVALVLAWSVSGIAHAAPLDAASVGSDAKWLVHVDFDAAHASKVLANARDEMLKHKRAKEMLSKIQDDLGMDLEKDLHGATAYGTTFKPHTGVLIVYAKADREKLMNHLKDKRDFKTTKDGDQEFYSWTEHHGHHHEHAVVFAIAKEGVGVFASTADEVKAALAVLGGKGGLSGNSPLVGDVPTGTIFHGAAAGMAEADLPVKMPLAKKIEQVSVSIGENEGTSFGTIKVEATSDDVAKQLKTIVEGFRAMAELHCGDDADATKLLNAGSIDANGKTFTIGWKVSADDVIKMGDKIREKIMEHRKAMKHAHDEKKDSDK